jgi:hypothetical protein
MPPVFTGESGPPAVAEATIETVGGFGLAQDPCCSVAAEV